MFRQSAHVYDALYGFKDYDREAERIRTLVEEHARTPARTGSLLDVACGTGRHLERLRAWFGIAGVELDPGMLAIARRRLPDVPLHLGDMMDFTLTERYDAVTCLFSAVGYLPTVARLRRAVANMARHLAPGGVLIVEPWFTPAAWRDGTLHLTTVDEPELKVARVSISGREARTAVLDMHYLVATPSGVERFEELHRLMLFTHDEYLEAFRLAGLDVTFDEQGLIGRGLYIGRAPAAAIPRGLATPEESSPSR